MGFYYYRWLRLTFNYTVMITIIIHFVTNINLVGASAGTFGKTLWKTATIILRKTISSILGMNYANVDNIIGNTCTFRC
jgi:hypothetical protein